MTERSEGRKKGWQSYAAILFVAFLDALLAVIFVYPNEFAPTSLLGVTVMLRHLFGLPSGYQFFLANVPLLLFAFFKLDRTHAVKSACYVFCFSAVSVTVQDALLTRELWHLPVVASTPGALVLIAVAYGAFEGIAYSETVLHGGSTGGTDILAVGIHKYRPRFPTVWILFSVKLLIAGMSYFVYDRKWLPVAAGILCGLSGSLTAHGMLRGKEKPTGKREEA